ncbi:HD domain-containing protein [Dyadobacter helix]|nr:hypothetical protein [Dyadobacter sp. CECT 9275]
MEYSNEIIEELFQRFGPVIGPDYYKYRNHVYRVFLNCLLIDSDKTNEAKYALAAVFHDIGIWTDHTIDYLDPSVAQAKSYLNQAGRADLIEEISLMIHWHHKVSTHYGKYEKTVETFRKADWIDVSLGVLTFGFDKHIISENRKKLPNGGFHWFLIKKTSANFLRHPLNPLPMFTR